MPIEHIEHKELALFISDELPRQRADAVKAHVHICSECEERLVDGLLSRIDAVNKAEANRHRVEHRAAKRLPGNGSGYVQSISPLSFDRLAAQIVDSSDGGLGLFATSPLVLGALVQICIGTDIILGEVRSCVDTANGQFRVGVKVQSSAHLRKSPPRS